MRICCRVYRFTAVRGHSRCKGTIGQWFDFSCDQFNRFTFKFMSKIFHLTYMCFTSFDIQFTFIFLRSTLHAFGGESCHISWPVCGGFSDCPSFAAISRQLFHLQIHLVLHFDFLQWHWEHFVFPGVSINGRPSTG